MDYYRDSYRIPKNAFWAWVGVSFAIGLALGLGFYLYRASAVTKQADALKKQISAQAEQSQTTVSSLQTQLSAAEASVTALNAQVQTAAADKAAAAQSTKQTTSSSTTTATLTVVARTITPSTVATDGSITMTAKVKGSPDRVTMRIIGKGSVSFDQTYNLTKSSTSGSVQTWKRTVSAPSKKGAYTYYATAYKNGKSATMPGASPSTLTVK